MLQLRPVSAPLWVRHQRLLWLVLRLVRQLLLQRIQLPELLWGEPVTRGPGADLQCLQRPRHRRWRESERGRLPAHVCELLLRGWVLLLQRQQLAQLLVI